MCRLSLVLVRLSSMKLFLFSMIMFSSQSEDRKGQKGTEEGVKKERWRGKRGEDDRGKGATAKSGKKRNERVNEAQEGNDRREGEEKEERGGSRIRGRRR